MTLSLCAVKRASELAFGEELQGLQGDPESVRNKLAEVFSNYLAEIWEIVQDFNQLLSGLGMGVSVLDRAVAPHLAEEAHGELEKLADEGKLSEFSQSTCNPGSRHLWLRFGDDGSVPPALRNLGDALAGLPGALEAKALEAQVPCPRLRLVPNLMAATYGHGSHYVPHKDMYSGGSCGFENTRMLGHC
eukprot:Skav218288  [mRNA]  locus=scaffold2035:791854:794101:- [translate_table: standard]